jgi:hypothetical protein
MVSVLVDIGCFAVVIVRSARLLTLRRGHPCKLWLVGRAHLVRSGILRQPRAHLKRVLRRRAAHDSGVATLDSLCLEPLAHHARGVAVEREQDEPRHVAIEPVQHRDLLDAEMIAREIDQVLAREPIAALRRNA